MSEAAATEAPSFCSQAEFARLQGWGKSYVTQLKHAGRLVFNAEGQVDVAASLERIQATTERTGQANEPALPPPLRAHRDRKEFYDAENARIDLEERLGKLMSAVEVLDAVADAAAMFAGQLEVLPDRLAPQIAALGADEGRIRALLADVLEGVRHDMVARLRGVNR